MARGESTIVCRSSHPETPPRAMRTGIAASRPAKRPASSALLMTARAPLCFNR
jgi:hypothetical protein